MDQIDAKNAREMAVVSLTLTSLLLDQRAMLGKQMPVSPTACLLAGDTSVALVKDGWVHPMHDRASCPDKICLNPICHRVFF